MGRHATAAAAGIELRGTGDSAERGVLLKRERGTVRLVAGSSRRIDKLTALAILKGLLN
jgi:hypothetical protein